MLNMELKQVLIAFLEALSIPKIYSRFDEYLAIQADDDFDSLLVCNIIRFFFNLFIEKENFLHVLIFQNSGNPGNKARY